MGPTALERSLGTGGEVCPLSIGSAVSLCTNDGPQLRDVQRVADCSKVTPSSSIAVPVPSQTVVAVGTLALSLYPQLAFDFRGARILSRGGIDGADKCLCEVLQEEAVAARSKYVIIGSGDKMFAEPAKCLKAQGSSIIVVGRRGTISHKLLAVASQVIYLNDKAFHTGMTSIMGPS